jgi:hypothetical protein
MMQICSWFTGKDPAVRNFFFGSGFKGAIGHGDKVLLAVDGSAVVGGLILSSNQVVLADSEDVRKRLLEEAQKTK